MATKTVIEVGQVKLTNKSDKVVQFIPYKENFATAIEAGKSVVLPVETVGQVFYYIKQANEDLAVEHAETGLAKEGDTVITLPQILTITNESTKSIAFVPYRENFQIDVAAGDSYEFEVKTAGQYIYYFNQETLGLDVDKKA